LAGKSPLDLWQASTAPSSWCIPFSIAGGPAVSLCVGFTDDGLPLGMQIAARPGADALLLQVGHAFEAATNWHKARPELEAGSRVRSDARKAAQPAAEVPDAELGWLSWHAHRAGIDTDEGRGAMLAAAHPIVQAMAERLRRPRPWQVESPNVFDASKDVT
jgi:aspartyl-tRNA(Asn)/glutamyl-tRNA(Gln) amidotransferase subunit A